MALFTNNADRNLPLLTQVYQINATNASEVKDLRERFVRQMLLKFGSQFDTQSEDWQQQFQRLTEAENRSDIETLCCLSQRIMKSLATENRIYRCDNEALSEFAARFNRDIVPQEYSFSFVIPESADLRNYAGEGWVDADRILHKEIPPLSEFMLNVAIFTELKALLLRGKHLLRVCGECGSVFLGTERTQEYCSQRCRRRLWMRTQRKREKNSRVEAESLSHEV